jgi:hypothetical protein
MQENKSSRVSLQLFDGPISMPALDFIKNGIIIRSKIHGRMGMHPKTTLPPQPPLALEIKKLTESAAGKQDENKFCVHDSRQQG